MSKRLWLNFAILSLFVAGMMVTGDSGGTDLSASYLSCRLLAAGQTSDLYSYDPVYFNQVGDPVWVQMAANQHIHVLLSPFVQTPLWPWVLQPMCVHMSFAAFNRVFELLLLLREPLHKF